MSQILNEELNRIKYLFGHEKGVVISEQKLIFEQVTGDTINDDTSIKTAVDTFNISTTNLFGKNPEFQVLSPYYGVDNNEYISISYPYLTNTFGAKKPFGIIGVNITKKQYKYDKSGSIPVDVSGNENGIPNFLVMKAYFSTGGKMDDGWIKFTKSKNYQPAISVAQALFNTIDPIFKKMISGQQPMA